MTEAHGLLADTIRRHMRGLLNLRVGVPALSHYGLQPTAAEVEKAAAELERELQVLMRPPVPERLLEIARETNLREHLHGVPPSAARPLLARFVQAVLHEMAPGTEPAVEVHASPAVPLHRSPAPIVALPVFDTMKETSR